MMSEEEEERVEPEVLEKVASPFGKVAEVVSDREVILNRGTDDGVQEGDYFKILDPLTVSIPDPDTGENLGGFKRIKIVVVAVEVSKRLTLARTFRRKTVNTGGQNAGLSSIAQMISAPKYVEQIERLRLDENAPRRLDPKDSVVSIGDPFETATSEEIEDTQSVTVWE